MSEIYNGFELQVYRHPLFNTLQGRIDITTVGLGDDQLTNMIETSIEMAQNRLPSDLMIYETGSQRWAGFHCGNCGETSRTHNDVVIILRVMDDALVEHRTLGM